MSESENVTPINGDQPQLSQGDRALDILNVLEPDVALGLSRGEDYRGRDERLIRDARAVAELIASCDWHDAYGELSASTIHDAAWLVSRMLTVAEGHIPESPWRKRRAQEGSGHE